MKRIALRLCAIGILLAGCEITQPVAGIGDRGEVYRGSVTASLSKGGSFTVTDGINKCTGTYDALTESRTVSFPVLCTDGRKGLGTATRDAGGITGSGTVRMNDGSSWSFVFGPTANLM